MSKVYKRIKELRIDNDLTQAKVAEMLGLYTTQYQRYESGERMIPFDLAIEVAKIYNVSIDYIAEISDERENVVKKLISLKK